MKKGVKYETPIIEITMFEVNTSVMNGLDFGDKDGQTVPWEEQSREDVTVDDLGLL